MAGNGSLKVAEQIRVIVAQTLSRHIHDPRLGFVTITDVQLSKDWHEARIFYTVLGTADEQAASAEGLKAATGQVRTAVAKGVAMRFTPTIEFVLDQLPQSSSEFEDLLASVRAEDARIAATSQGAQFAGDEDPYKHPEEDEDE